MKMSAAKVVQLNRTQNHTESQLKKISETDRMVAIGKMIDQYRAPLFHHAICILKDEDEAYDVVQETFIRAIKESRLFNVDFLIKAWLYRVTSNLCFNHMRNTRRRKEILNENPLPSTRKATQIGDIFSGERQILVMKAIEKLAKDHQQILILRYYQDLSYIEIAQTLELKIGTVMSRLSRARSTLLMYLERKKPFLSEWEE